MREMAGLQKPWHVKEWTPVRSRGSVGCVDSALRTLQVLH